MALMFDEGEESAREIRALMPLVQEGLQRRFDGARTRHEQREVIKDGLEMTALLLRGTSPDTGISSEPKTEEPKTP